MSLGCVFCNLKSLSYDLAIDYKERICYLSFYNCYWWEDELGYF